MKKKHVKKMEHKPKKKKYSKKAEKKIHKVMKEFDKGELHSARRKGLKAGKKLKKKK